MRIIAPALLVLALLAGCSTSRITAPPETGPLTLGETEKRYPLKDDLRPLAGFVQILPVGEDELIVSDNSSRIYLFREYEMEKVIGSEGTGYCQYNIIWSIDRKGDSLFVQNAQKPKIITYNIRTGNCLGQIPDSLFSSPQLVTRGNGEFIVGRTHISERIADSTTMLYSLSDTGEWTPFPLKLDSLDPLELHYSITVYGRNIARSQDHMYIQYLATDIMNVLNTQTGSIRQFPLQIDIKREVIKKAREKGEDLPPILNNGAQMVRRIYAGDHWVAVSVITVTGNGDTTEFEVQFYHPDGTFRGAVNVDKYPIATHNNQMLFLHRSQDPDSKYRWELSYRPIISGSRN